MLVGIDASRAVAEERTGTENYSVGLIRALALRGRYRYRLYSRAPLPPELRTLAVETRILRARRLWTHTRLAWEVARRPPDVLWIPAHVLPLTHPRASLVTVHDVGFRRFPQAHPRKQWLYLELSTRWAVRRAAALLADSEATRCDLVKLYGVDPGRVTVVYPAADRRFQPAAAVDEAKQLGAAYELAAPYRLHVGTLQPRKNIGTLIEAFGRLARRMPALTLALAGGAGWGGEHERLRVRVAREGLAQRVRFLGHVSAADLPALVRQAAVVVLPSLFEGFGMPLVEAMASGTPTVASDTSSIPEVVDDAGLLVSPLDVEAWSEALGRALEDNELRTVLRERGLVRAAQFTWERSAEAVEVALSHARVSAT